MGKINRILVTGCGSRHLRPDLPLEGEYDQRVRDCIEIFPRL